jgi:succinoglycan biosynthesis transport protein ExoP
MNDDVKIVDLLGVLRRRRGLIAFITVLGTGLICAVPALLPARYTAKSQILIEPQSLIAGKDSVVEQSPDEAVVQTEVAALTSPGLLQRTIESLANDPDYQAAMHQIGQSGRSVGALWDDAMGWLDSWSHPTAALRGTLDMRALQRQLRVFPEAGSHVISVSATSSSPNVAAIIANRVTDLFVQSEDQQKRASTDRALAWLSERIPNLKDEGIRTNAAAQTYRAEHKMAGTDPGAVTNQELDGLNRELATAETELAGISARAAAVRGLQKKGVGADQLLGYLESPRIDALATKLSTLQQFLAIQRATFVHGSPVTRDLETDLAEVRSQIQMEVQRAVTALNSQEGIATARVMSLKGRLAAIADGGNDVRLADLERQAATSRQLYDTMVRRREELQEQRESLSPGVRVLSVALTPDRPSSISPLLFIPPAFVLSLLCGMCCAFVKERLDPTLRCELDVSGALDVECIGLVPRLPRLRGKRPHQLLIGQPYSQYTESIRSVAMALKSANELVSRTIVVTSSVPGEGKTVFAASLATYLATLGQRVILVDFDFRSSSVLREFGGDSDRSLHDVLLYNRPVDEVIQHVPRMQLDFIAGSHGVPVDPLSLQVAERMKRLLSVLRQRYAVIVIDSAPMLVVAESRLLPAMADDTLFVVEWGRTRRAVARNAIGLTRAAASGGNGRSPSIRAVITQVDLRKHAQYRYGDSGECFVEYNRYISRPSMVAVQSIRHGAHLPGGSGQNER